MALPEARQRRARRCSARRRVSRRQAARSSTPPSVASWRCSPASTTTSSSAGPSSPSRTLPMHYLLSRALARAGRSGSRPLPSTQLLDDADGRCDRGRVAAALSSTTTPPTSSSVTRSRPVWTTSTTGRRSSCFRWPNRWMRRRPRADTANGSTELLVECLVTRARRVLDAVGARAQPGWGERADPGPGSQRPAAADPAREFGLDGIGNLDGSTATRWAYGRSLSIDQIADLAATSPTHGHSVGVVDGYVYVQSRWKPTEQPKQPVGDEARR